MEAEVDKLRVTSRKGDMTGITKGYSALKDQLDVYFKGLEADKDGDVVSSDPTGAWHKAATALTKEIMDKVSPYMRTAPIEKEGGLGPLRRIMGKVADLNEAAVRAEDAPEEERLSALGRELSKVKRDVMSLGRVLMMSQDPSLAAGAHKLVGEAEDTIRAGQQKVRAGSRIGHLGDRQCGSAGPARDSGREQGSCVPGHSASNTPGRQATSGGGGRAW
jgi:methionine aminopeptidase